MPMLVHYREDCVVGKQASSASKSSTEEAVFGRKARTSESASPEAVTSRSRTSDSRKDWPLRAAAPGGFTLARGRLLERERVEGKQTGKQQVHGTDQGHSH
jgi:hypothetical protein